jgi:transcriptional regulator with XRE-family HTH domain
VPKATRREINILDLVGESPTARSGFETARYALEAAGLVQDMRKAADGGHSITQSELARRLEMTPTRVNTIERGDGPLGPTYALLKKIARACNVRLVVTIMPN